MCEVKNQLFNNEGIGMNSVMKHF